MNRQKFGLKVSKETAIFSLKVNKDKFFIGKKQLIKKEIDNQTKN